MRGAALGLIALAQLIPACGPDWDALLASRGTSSRDASVDVNSARFRNPRDAAGEDDPLIRGTDDAGPIGDAGRDAGVIVEQAR
jgi:hypothetical protein